MVQIPWVFTPLGFCLNNSLIIFGKEVICKLLTLIHLSYWNNAQDLILLDLIFWSSIPSLLTYIIYLTLSSLHSINFSSLFLGSVQFSSVTQSFPTLCNPMNCSTPGLPVHHQLLEFTQTHVHWVSDAIQPSHSLSSPSPPALNPSQHQSLFQWVNSSHEVAKVLEFQL